MKYLFFNIAILFNIFLSIGDFEDEIEEENRSVQSKDSIEVWIGNSKSNAFDYTKRRLFLDKAYKNSLKEVNDSLQNNYFLKIAYSYYRIGDTLLFRKTNNIAYKLAVQRKDSMMIARTYRYLGNFHMRYNVKDSAYYSYFKAQKIYELIKNDYNSGRMLLNMAIIQAELKDYTGSEITTTRAILLLKPLERYKQLYSCYNNLGIISNELEEYDKALNYHEEALKYQKKIKGINTLRENTLNNIGVVYEMKGDYKEAINYYNLALGEKNLKKNNTILYSMLLDNIAYSKLKLKDTSGVRQLFFNSLKIRDSINFSIGIMINKLHLAEYYLSLKDTAKALQFGNEVKELASQTKDSKELLSSLLLLSELDKKNSSKYANQYITLNDSLQKQERVIRNKFARIRFETDEFIEKNERLSRQTEIIIGISSFIVLAGLFVFILKVQQSKNKELKLEQRQQKANEEIYNLILAQQNKLEEGKRQEKKRISQELHDGVLGKLFGIRLILGTLNNDNKEETVSKRLDYIGQLQEVEEDVRNVSHELHDDSLASDVSYANLIESLLETQSKITNFEYQFAFDKEINWEQVNGSLKMNLYRIIQESIQNINKYAKAKNVDINFKNEDDIIHLMIKDDGVGFSMNKKAKGIGLKNMQARVNGFNGKLAVRSKPGQGTSIDVEVPYKA